MLGANNRHDSDLSNGTKSSAQTLRHTNYHSIQKKKDDPEDERTPLTNKLPPLLSTSSSSSSSTSKRKERWTGWMAITASVISIVLCVTALVGFGINLWRGNSENVDNVDGKGIQSNNPVYNSLYASRFYDLDGRYIVEDYDVQPPLSNMLPGLAGYYGKPLYAFYVNRGQGMASFGFESKDYPIQEYHSANIAYQSTHLTGFRTFIQGTRHVRGKTISKFLIEPFSPLQSRFLDKHDDSLPKRYMYMGANEVQFQEIDHINNVETNTTFFILPEEQFGALVKRTTITNLDSRQWRIKGSPILNVSILDGLAQIQPAGGKMNEFLKSIGRTLEAWKGVYSPFNDTYQMPFYRLSMQPSDSADVTFQEAGHWCLSLLEGNDDDEPILLPIMHDPSKIFADDSTLTRPIHLYSVPISDIIRQQQFGLAKTASAFATVADFSLAPGESLTMSTFYGKAEHCHEVPVVARRLLEPGLAEFKYKRIREIPRQITTGIETKTSNRLFDEHVQQMFLDNCLRGGVPSLLGEVDDDARMRSIDEDNRLKAYHVFARVHGDLERDYNNFVVEPTFFSNGPGNFRDVIQNRRNDVFFNPRIGSFNVKSFLSLIQADAYNPLSVEAVAFTISDMKVCKWIASVAVGEADGVRAQREALTFILNDGPFRPGQLFLIMEKQHIELVISQQEFIDMVASAAKTSPVAVFKDGFWADHWTYYVDIIRTYLSIYPDWEGRIMFEEQLPYYFSPAFVQPRDDKYVLSVSFDGNGHHVRQLNATITKDEDKIAYQSRFIRKETGWYDLEANWQHSNSGAIFTSTAFEKLVVLATLKFATRDPYGMALEYEAGKPGWNDANNGLVGMLGSGTPELYELHVLLKFIQYLSRRYRKDIVLPVEVFDLIQTINNALDMLRSSYVDNMIMPYPKVPDPLFTYWDTVASARELYRTKTKVVFSGSMEPVPNPVLDATLERWINEVELGMERALKFGTRGDNDDGSSGIAPTYFSYNVTKWQRTGKHNYQGHPLVVAREMVVNLFPLFLEGPTRLMKTMASKTEALALYQRVRSSTLRDDKLQMYTISASLKGASIDMGREVAFAPGWLENQSVWLHMSYKFYLELLRHKLYDAFFDEMTSGGFLPFMDANMYGRSLTECSSFIVSSAFEDPSLHGRGFLGRLSGSTAEFLSMWVLLFIGPNPFFLDKKTGQLAMQLVPTLPRWLFKDDGNGFLTVSFRLFSAIDVTYNLKTSRNLYDTPPTKYVVELRDGTVLNVDGPTIDSVLSEKIRRVAFVSSINAFFD